jgi:hypothetical protein
MEYQKLLPFVYEGTFTWTMTTNGYKFYTLNLVRWLTEVAKVPWKLCIICCDIESLTYFRREGIPCIGYKSGEHKGQASLAPFGTADFNRWNRTKLEIFKVLCYEADTLGIQESLYLDGDIVVQKDPWPVLKGMSESFVFQCDCFHQEEHLESDAPGCEVICSGVLRIRHTGLTEVEKQIFDFDRELWQTCDGDQSYIAARLKAAGIRPKTLPRRQFGNGTWQKSGAWKDGDWILLHYNYREGNTKRAAMKTFGHWRIPY